MKRLCDTNITIKETIQEFQSAGQEVCETEKRLEGTLARLHQEVPDSERVLQRFNRTFSDTHVMMQHLQSSISHCIEELQHIRDELDVLERFE